MIEHIQIQTKQECNLRCSFCPNSYIPQTGRLMTEKILNKIIKDLKKINFKGKIFLYLMNEPTLDKRIFKWISKIRKEFRENIINISTNATLIDEDYIQRLFAVGLSDLDISCYSTKILDRYISLKSDKIHIHNFINPETVGILYNRGGNVNIGKGNIGGFCERPFEQMYIKWNGKAVLCCSDYKSEVVMGDVNKNTLSEIWNNGIYKKYREHLIEGKRDLPLCNRCNYLGDVSKIPKFN